MAFEELYYKGESVKLQRTIDGIQYFEHIYFNNFLGLDSIIDDKTNAIIPPENPKRRHACLQMGYFCWKNLLTHPQDLLKYLKFKIQIMFFDL